MITKSNGFPSSAVGSVIVVILAASDGSSVIVTDTVSLRPSTLTPVEIPEISTSKTSSFSSILSSEVETVKVTSLVLAGIVTVSTAV